MGRAITNHGALQSNPYPVHREIVAEYTHCETCDRTLKTRDWQQHVNGKQHDKVVREKRQKENPPGGHDPNYPTASDSYNDSYTGNDWAADGQDNNTTDWSTAGNSNSGFGRGNTSGNAQGGRFSGACYGCGEEGHSKANCPKSAGQGCFNCGQPGHRKAECTEPARGGGGGGGGDRKCFNCDQPGHTKAECSNERVMKCRNCDRVGHVGRDCPEPKDWSRVQCNNCKEYGHTIKRCKMPVPEPDPTDDNGWGGIDTAPVATGGWGDDTAATGGWNDNGIDGNGDAGFGGDTQAEAGLNW